MTQTGVDLRPVHIVVVAYHQPGALEECLRSAAGEARITVIDNSSNREVRSVAGILGATYVDPGKNLGFGAGVNIALRRILSGEPVDVLLLNPDALIQANDVRRLQHDL